MDVFTKFRIPATHREAKIPTSGTFIKSCTLYDQGRTRTPDFMLLWRWEFRAKYLDSKNILQVGVSLYAISKENQFLKKSCAFL